MAGVLPVYLRSGFGAARMKILLVEGESKLASFVKKSFENEGYDFSGA